MENKPVLFIDADEEDQLVFKRALQQLDIKHPILVFSEGQAALDHLRTNAQTPFLIISEISLPGLSGLELRQQIEQDDQLRKKLIPFVFMTYPVVDHLVEQAYELTIQGLFEKETSYTAWKNQLGHILTYWQECYHPKRIMH